MVHLSEYIHDQGKDQHDHKKNFRYMVNFFIEATDLGGWFTRIHLGSGLLTCEYDNSDHGASSYDSIRPCSVIQIKRLFFPCFTVGITAQKIIDIITGRCIQNRSLDFLKFMMEKFMMGRSYGTTDFPIGLTIKLISFNEYRAWMFGGGENDNISRHPIFSM